MLVGLLASCQVDWIHSARFALRVVFMEAKPPPRPPGGMGKKFAVRIDSADILLLRMYIGMLMRMGKKST